MENTVVAEKMIEVWHLGPDLTTQRRYVAIEILVSKKHLEAPQLEPVDGCWVVVGLKRAESNILAGQQRR